jgi:hypothetical protein
MRNLKHLKLFEAFQSESLSKVIGFISSKIGKQNSEKFVETLRGLLKDTYDIQIDKISDLGIKYLPAKSALQIKPSSDEEIFNPYGIYTIKFWFSLKNGYLGCTGVSKDSGPTESGLSSYLVDKFKEALEDSSIGSATGELTQVTDYRDLSTGDYVIGMFSSDDDNYGAISLARIVLENDKLFAIQDVRDGGAPDGRDWRRWGRYSWCLGDVDRPDTDHHYLYKYTPSSEELNFTGLQHNEQLIGRRGTLSRDSRNNWMNLTDIKEADFAIVLYFDTLFKEESVTDIQKWRKESREGATALMSDEEIRKLNYNNYLKRIIALYGLKEITTESELKNIQNIFATLLCGQMFIFTIKPGIPNFSNLSTIMNSITNLIKAELEYKQQELESLASVYRSCRKESEKYEKVFKLSFERVLDSGDKKTIDFFNRLLEISKMINTSIRDKNYNTIGDLLILKMKLQSINDFFLEIADKYFNRGIEVALDNFKYNDNDVNRGAITCSERPNLDEDIKGLEIFERFVKQTLVSS